MKEMYLCFHSSVTELKFVTKDLFHRMLPMVQVMAWSQADDKPLSEPQYGPQIKIYYVLC